MTTPVFEPASLSEFLLKAFPREYVSASSLKMFVRCPEQWRRRYVLGHKAPPSGALIWGGADHRAVAANFSQKVESETDLPVAEVQERFVHEVEQGLESVEDDVLWDGKDFAGKTVDQSVALVKDRGTALVAAYQEQVASSLFPVSVEKEFLLPINGLPPVKGYLDLTAQRFEGFLRAGLASRPPVSSPMIVVERKTKGMNAPPAPEDRFQGRLYELATGLPVEFQVSVKTAAPRVVVHEPDDLAPPATTVQALKRTVLGIASCYALYGEEQPWPDNGRLHTFACSYCGFRETCPFWHPEFWPK